MTGLGRRLEVTAGSRRVRTMEVLMDVACPRCRSGRTHPLAEHMRLGDNQMRCSDCFAVFPYGLHAMLEDSMKGPSARTPRGFFEYGELVDSDGSTVTVRQSSADPCDKAHLFCRAARRVEDPAEVPPDVLLMRVNSDSPYLDRAQATELAIALLRFAADEEVHG